jgi:nitrite reductase/ring-hydroxylating ferredoxin subunit
MSSADHGSNWVPIAKTTDACERHGTALEVGGEPLALFVIDGCRYVTSNVCTHQLAFLTDGYVEGEYVECPMHQGRFHIPTGTPQGPPLSMRLRTYPVRVDGEDVLVDLSSPAS